MDNDFKKWISQFRKGYLELYALTLLKDNNFHGSAIIKKFLKGGIEVNEGTLYPLLNRMQDNGWLHSSWDLPDSGGHPKRIYSISKNGISILPKMQETYYQYQQNIDNIL